MQITGSIQLEDFTEEQRAWAARAIAGMITADGVVSSSELVYLREVITNLSTIDQINDIVSMVKARKKIALLRLDTDTVTAINILFHLASISVSDGLSKLEIDFFAHAAQKLGLSKGLFQEILQFIKDYEKLNLRKKAIMAKAKACNDLDSLAV
jgi:hypothetical protein